MMRRIALVAGLMTFSIGLVTLGTGPVGAAQPRVDCSSNCRTNLEARPVLQVSPLKVYSFIMSATLTAQNRPLKGEIINFCPQGFLLYPSACGLYGYPDCIAVTNAHGVATCPGRIDVSDEILGAGYQAVFDGDGTYLSSVSEAHLMRL